MRKRRILFAGFVTRMDNERTTKTSGVRVRVRVRVGERVTREGKNKTGWVVSSTTLSTLKLPTEAKHWTLAAKKPGERFRRVEEAAEQYLKRWFVTEKEQVAK